MTIQRDKVRAYVARHGVDAHGMSARGIDFRAIEIAISRIAKRANACIFNKDSATLETIAAGLVALDVEDAT